MITEEMLVYSLAKKYEAIMSQDRIVEQLKKELKSKFENKMSFPSMSTEENKCLKTELETNFDEMDLNMLLKQIVKMNLQFYNNY